MRFALLLRAAVVAASVSCSLFSRCGLASADEIVTLPLDGQFTIVGPFTSLPIYDLDELTIPIDVTVEGGNYIGPGYGYNVQAGWSVSISMGGLDDSLAIFSWGACFNSGAPGCMNGYRSTSALIGAPFPQDPLNPQNYATINMETDLSTFYFGDDSGQGGIPGLVSPLDVTITADLPDGFFITPLPPALPLFAFGCVLIGLFGWRSKRSAAS